MVGGSKSITSIGPVAPSVILLATATVLTMLSVSASDEPFEVICPADPDSVTVSSGPDYCDCVIMRKGLSRMLQVKCNFNNERAALLTENIYAIGSNGFSSAYVRINNARSVTVTEGFMKEWQQALSSALDIWHSGTVVLSASPPIKKSSFKTFIGIGIIDCNLPELPSMLIRDHHRGALRIKQSTVGVIQPNFIHNIDELRYLVLEDSSVVSFAGPVTSQTPLILSSRDLHSWNGLLLDNVTINFIAPSAFNISHKVGPEEVVMKNCHIGEMGTGGLVVTGAISLNISGNIFDKLRQNAIQSNIDQELVFSSNILLSWEDGAISAMQCPPSNNSVLDHNTLAMPLRTATLFHSSCGTPKVIVSDHILAEMLSSLSSKKSTDSTNGGDGSAATTVVMLLLLVAVVCGGVAGTWWWRRNRVWSGTMRDTLLCEDHDQPDSIVTTTNSGVR